MGVERERNSYHRRVVGIRLSPFFTGVVFPRKVKPWKWSLTRKRSSQLTKVQTEVNACGEMAFTEEG